MATTGNILVTSFAPRSRSHGARHVTSQSRGLCRTGVVMCYGGRQLAATRQIVRGEAMMVLAPRTPAAPAARGYWSWSTVTVFEQNKMNALLPAKQLLDMHFWCW